MFGQHKPRIFYALEMYCYAVLCNITTDIFRAESAITKYRQPAGAVDRDPERRDGERGHRAMYGKPIKKKTIARTLRDVIPKHAEVTA